MFEGYYADMCANKFPLTPMGVLAPVSAQRDTPLSPPSTSAEIFRRTCLQSSLKKNLKNPGGEVKFSKNSKFPGTGKTHGPLKYFDFDGGLSGVSRCADTGARTPIGISGNYIFGLSSIFATSSI